MDYFVYVIYSHGVDRYYIGQTDNLEERLSSHTNKKSRYTSIASDWKLVYTEKYSTRTEAIRRERQIKSAKSRKYIEQLIGD